MGENALENLGLNVGDTVKVYIDTDLMCLMIEPQPLKTTAKRKSGHTIKNNER